MSLLIFQFASEKITHYFVFCCIILIARLIIMTLAMLSDAIILHLTTIIIAPKENTKYVPLHQTFAHFRYID